MNQPRDMEERFAELERLEQIIEGNLKRLTIRDSSVKIGIAEGLAESTHKEISQLKLEMIQVRAEMKELRNSTDQQFEDIRERLDRQETIVQESFDEVTKKLDMVLRSLNQGYSK